MKATIEVKDRENETLKSTIEVNERDISALRSTIGEALQRAVGALISGSRDAYTYLPESVKKFPAAEALAAEFREAGFERVEYELMTFGIVALHLARKGSN